LSQTTRVQDPNTSISHVAVYSTPKSKVPKQKGTKHNLGHFQSLQQHC